MIRLTPSLIFLILITTLPLKATEPIFQYQNKFDLSQLDVPESHTLEKSIKRTYTIKKASPTTLISAITKLYPAVKTVSFPESNQLILSGKKERLEELLTHLPQWDIPPKKVKFTLEFYEVSKSTLKEIDTELSTLSEGIQISYPLTKSPLDYPKNLAQTIKLLRTEDKASLLAKPSIETLIGHEATIQIGDQIPYISKTIHADRVDTFLNQLHTGISIKILPSQKINTTIQTTLAISVTNVKLWKQIGDSELPIITERRLTTEAPLIIGESMMIAGLLQEEKKENRRSTPFLGKIPLLKHLFSASKYEWISTDVVILITPELN